MEIRITRENELDQVLAILNETTLDLENKGIQQCAYSWEHTTMQKAIKEQCSYVIVLKQNIIGTFCIHPVNVVAGKFIAKNSQYLSTIAILPRFQGRNIGVEILCFARSHARKLKAPLYLDCWAGNDKLKAFYTKNGLTYVGDFPEEDYFVSVFTEPI